MDDKLKWFYDWNRRGRPVAVGGKLAFIPLQGLVTSQLTPASSGKVMVSDRPDGASNETRQEHKIWAVSADEVESA